MMGDEDRMAGRVMQHRLEAEARQLVEQPLPGSPDIYRMRRVGRDAGDAQKFNIAADGLIEILRNMLQHGSGIGHGRGSLDVRDCGMIRRLEGHLLAGASGCRRKTGASTRLSCKYDYFTSPETAHQINRLSIDHGRLIAHAPSETRPSSPTDRRREQLRDVYYRCSHYFKSRNKFVIHRPPSSISNGKKTSWRGGVYLVSSHSFKRVERPA
jgi:hypothetical protein